MGFCVRNLGLSKTDARNVTLTRHRLHLLTLDRTAGGFIYLCNNGTFQEEHVQILLFFDG